MSSLIKNMLSVNRLERESISPEIDFHNIVQILTTSLNRFEEIANRKGISLHFESQVPIFMAQTDQEYLTEIIDNLVSNAIKFSYADSSVSVKLECTSSYFEIAVQDQGQGILPEEMNLLFGRFQKLSAKPTSNESSTGLGLSIVKELAEQLGGTVSCDSQIGKGTCFTVKFKS
jgi:signal transduction histidine kinase